jgi:hypothetical protein
LAAVKADKAAAATAIAAAQRVKQEAEQHAQDLGEELAEAEAAQWELEEQLQAAQHQVVDLTERLRNPSWAGGSVNLQVSLPQQLQQCRVVLLRPLRDTRGWLTPEAIHSLQGVLERFNLQGGDLKNMFLQFLGIVLTDSTGQPLSQEELQQAVQLPAKSAMYEHTQLMGLVHTLRQVRAVRASPGFGTIADGGEIGRSKRLMVSLTLQHELRGALARMGALPLVSGSGQHQYDALELYFGRHNSSVL